MNKFETRIDNYLLELGLTILEKPEPNRWYVKVNANTGEVEFFVIEILLLDGWISFSSVAIINLQGRNLGKFYESLLRLSSYLHAFKFGVSNNGEVVTLQTEWSLIELDKNTFQGIITNYVTFYREWYPQIIEYATHLNLKFRKSLVPYKEIDLFVNRLVAMKDYKVLGSDKRKPIRKLDT